MAFVDFPGLPGKIYVPDADPKATKKHPCPDCRCCQECSARRCLACRGREDNYQSEYPEPDA
jgi:hypothetical protein